MIPIENLVKTVPVEMDGEKILFMLDEHQVSYIGQGIEDEVKGRAFRGFVLRCRWKKNVSEYVFVIETDMK